MMEDSYFQPLPTLPWWKFFFYFWPLPILTLWKIVISGPLPTPPWCKFFSFYFWPVPILTWRKILISGPYLLSRDGSFIFLVPAYMYFNIVEDSSFWALPTSPWFKFLITRPCLVYHDGSDPFLDPTCPTIMEVFFIPKPCLINSFPISRSNTDGQRQSSWQLLLHPICSPFY